MANVDYADGFSFIDNGSADWISDAQFSDWVAATSAENAAIGGGYAPKSIFGDILDTVKSTTDFGIKAYSQLSAAQTGKQVVGLNAYLAKNQAELAKVNTSAQIDIAKINAATNAKLANARLNMANTSAVAGNIGAGLGNSPIMLWLTIAGVAVGIAQLAKSK